MLETFTAQTFTPLIGTTFRVGRDPAPTVPLTLSAAAELGGGGPPGAPGALRRTPFALLFYGPPDVLLPQRIYPVAHDTLGAFDLFLVPLGPDVQGMRYEAIFT